MLGLRKEVRLNRDALEFIDLLLLSSVKPWYESNSRTRLLSGTHYLPLKRFIDITLSIFLLIPALLLIGLCAAAIKLDSKGPVFYMQERTGKGGKRFKMFKLRTMVQDADSMKEKYAYLNKLRYPDFKASNDPRTTKVGVFLRKTSLDELPQILNVIRGEMSLVGPRPTSFPSSSYSLWHTARLEVKPGVTGLWQVSGRSDVGFDERNRLDIAYLQNLCLWLDLKILLRTIGAVIKCQGAE